MNEPLSGSGRQSRLEGPQKVSGEARYTSDLVLPGQLYGGILRSPHAHARIRGIDAGAARRLPGVRDVMTAREAPPMAWYEEGVPLFPDTIRFAGEEVAAVAADSEEAVLDALRAIVVEYELLPPVIGLDAAAAPGAPRVHEDAAGNRAGEAEVYCRGDVEAGFEAADVLVEATYTTATALHNALEPHGCNAWWEGDVLNLWVSTQGIFAVREGVAGKLHLPLNRVRVRAEHVGGGFGAKQIEWKETLIAALLARRCGRPVRLMLDREGENLAAGNRNATRQRVRLGATRDGRLRAIEVHAELEIGAYRVGGESSQVTGCFQELYACDNVRTEQRQYYSTNGPAVAFRAPGYVEGSFALEQAMDELAVKLGLDPFELRLLNYAGRSQDQDKAWSSPDALRHCQAAARQAFDWDAPRIPPADPRKRRGRGMAAGIWVAGGPSPPAHARVCLHPDGSATLVTGTQDIGTGTRTVLAQIAAAELGLPVDRLRVELGDTAGELYAPTSSGSCTLASMGPAVHQAAARAKAQAKEAGGKRGVPVYGHGSCGAKPDAVTVRTFAVHCAEVEVDLDSGEIRLLRLVCAPDCGRIVNRRLADSQVIGGLVQGVGFALMEERFTDPRLGTVLNPDLEHYLVPAAPDVPVLVHAPVDIPDLAVNALGVKGLGEPPMIAVAPAIANAVFDATGLRLRELPLKRRRLLEARQAGGRT